jgi:hypothetical protein
MDGGGPEGGAVGTSSTDDRCARLVLLRLLGCAREVVEGPGSGAVAQSTLLPIEEE